MTPILLEKYLFKLSDKALIEVVMIPEVRRLTLCLSSQVGCKFKCGFCASGTHGFQRNLSCAEMVGQLLFINDALAPRKVTNIVFMGIGEPLDNFSELIKTVSVLLEPKGIYFGKRRICISTCGLIPEIKKLSELKLGIKLSVSLHTPDNNLRSAIMPVNKKYPLPDLIKALKACCRPESFLLTFEYTLIKDFNTSAKDAQALVRLLRGLNYKLNLISLHEACGKFMAPEPEEIEAFQQGLKARGVFFTMRKSRGQEIAAACGQLRASYQSKVESL